MKSKIHDLSLQKGRTVTKKVMGKKFFTLLALIIFTKLSFGQYQQYVQYIMPYLSDTIKSGYFYLNQPNNIQAGQLYETYRQNAPDLNNDMILIDSHTDSLAGLTHFKYQQTYMNIPIEGAGCIEHYNVDGSLLFLNGKFADSITRSHRPRLSKEKAVTSLISFLSKDTSNHFAWNDPDWEQQIQNDLNDTTATWYPEAELMWSIDTMKNMQVVIPGNRYTLAYKISITTTAPFETNIYHVSAQNGSILKVRSTQVNDGPTDVYGYGSKIIDTRWRGGFIHKYELHALDNTHSIHTRKLGNFYNTNWNSLSDTRDADDNWGSVYLTETSTHYHVTNAWDFYKDYFNRIGMNGIGNSIRVKTQWERQQAGYVSSVTPNELIFGKSTTLWDYGMEPTIVGHEFTHGVINYTSALEYEYESGALNESFCDILGTAIQALTLDNGNTDWIIGNHIPDAPTRSLDVPNTRGTHWLGSYDVNGTPEYATGQPDTYGGQYWCNNCPLDVDIGGVHINSGVQNKWFHVLANGDQDYNDLNDYYDVDGIGILKSTQIAYYAFTSILMNSSQYTDSRQATVQAAKILFGECSTEHKATADAWYAVGVGNLNSCEPASTSERNKGDIVIYPNPTEGEVRFEFSDNQNKSISVFDMSGRIINSYTTNERRFQINLKGNSKGVYLIKIQSNQTTQTEKIILK